MNAGIESFLELEQDSLILDLLTKVLSSPNSEILQYFQIFFFKQKLP